ncbi:LysR family substrate-binding domain-containing protein [Microbacterium sp. zg.Y1090]|uniref:LysR family substrate-binding domain-containing protein n=1 Tax=Microbacterium wangruii TaxID=3049073 RepID=UPI00214D373B|nr:MULTISPECIES: LysR family substrate-binding domain-containing protein [unclassified Microbacterium]MCR2819687.1 LysR family substrate-binding domain-containing protein [Microbacterium sp. zg.Y1090]WIM28069.1 LysR family substrate-binding domain-containing protein [Microbacterium sp. zg-Y1090]
MARGGSGRSHGTPRRPAARPAGKGAKAAQAGKAAKGAHRPQRPAAPRAEPSPEAAVAPGPFRLGAIPGATPGKWIDLWTQRMPRNPLELVPLTVAWQREALTSGEVDAALVRTPIDAVGLSAIPLYDEQPVVVCSADSHLTAAEELTLEDLAGEVLIVPDDAVVDAKVPGAVPPSFAAPTDTAEAVETVAAGVGILIVPMSLARLHHRRDITFRPLRDGPTSPVALAWPTEATTPLVETFIGIVRGRTANSSRG